jgi:HlyD family secretion protein
MDIARTAGSSRKSRRLIVGAAVLIVALVLTTVALGRLERAAAPVDKSTLVLDTVRRGPLTIEVRGAGVLTPEEVRWIAASTDARVERVVLQPGAVVHANDVIIELSDPQQQQATLDAQWQLRAAESSLEAMRAQLASERLDREASLARLRSEYQQARLRAAADAELEKQGLAAKITRQLSQTSADELQQRVRLEEERVRVSVASQSARLAEESAAVEQRRANHGLQQERSRSLQVRAGIDGVLQQIAVQSGQRVTAGATLARVAQAGRLKAEVRVAEMQAKDIAIGQPAKIDTRNGVVDARVTRIDPAVREGTVTVDLRIEGPLPAGARPDLSVDATIQLDRVADTLFVTRPVGARENATGSIYKVGAGEKTATRVPVQFGRASATTIEIRSGLRDGDRVIVSDSNAFDTHEKVELQ